MRLHLILPRVESEEIKPPSECPYEGCNGTRFQFIQKGNYFDNVTFQQGATLSHFTRHCEPRFLRQPAQSVAKGSNLISAVRRLLRALRALAMTNVIVKLLSLARAQTSEVLQNPFRREIPAFFDGRSGQNACRRPRRS